MRGRLLTGILALVLVAAAAAVPASADDTTSDEPAEHEALTPAISPQSIEIAIELAHTTDKLEGLQRRAEATQRRLVEAQSLVELTSGFISSNRPTIVTERAMLKEHAALAYQRHASALDASIAVPSPDDAARADRYLRATTTLDSFQLDNLTLQERALEQAQTERASARDEIAESATALERERATLEDLRARQQVLLVAWGSLPVMGESRVSADQLAAWYRSTGQRPTLAPGTTIEELARFYIEEGQAEGVRGDVAFAQGVLESAYFSVAAGNNYAGIGACDSCSGGFGFASPREGVRAQIQLLRNYADPDSRAANLANPPVKGLHPEDPAAAARVFDTFFLKGKVPLWNQMGNGNWATDPLYSGKVIALYARIVAYTAAHPA
jgi:hypothetical protein